MRTTPWDGDDDFDQDGGSKTVGERRKGASSQVKENEVEGSGARTAGAGDVRLAVPQYYRIRRSLSRLLDMSGWFESVVQREMQVSGKLC
jgi:hypothetical protein